MIVPGELQQAGMKADRSAVALEHRALEVVVDQGPGRTAVGAQALDMAAMDLFSDWSSVKSAKSARE